MRNKNAAHVQFQQVRSIDAVKTHPVRHEISTMKHIRNNWLGYLVLLSSALLAWYLSRGLPGFGF